MIWALLSDGRYLRIFLRQAARFIPLRFEDLPAYAALNYLVINGKPAAAEGKSHKAKPLDYIQCQIDFLSAQQDSFEALVLIAKAPVLASFHAQLPAPLAALVIAELAEDLTAQSSDIIASKITQLLTV